MLSKGHPHFKPLRRSYWHFSISGTILLYLGTKVLSGGLDRAFIYAGVFSLVLGFLAFYSIVANKPMEYHGVFTLETQRRIRIVGLFLPFLLVGGLIAGDCFYRSSGCLDMVDDCNRWIKFERIKANKSVDFKQVENFSNRVTNLILIGPEEKLVDNIQRLDKREISHSLVYKMKRYSNSSKLVPLSSKLPSASQITSLHIDKPIIEGLSKQYHYLKVRANFCILHSDKRYLKPIQGSFVYHIGLRYGSKNKEFVIAKIFPEVSIDQPNDLVQ